MRKTYLFIFYLFVFVACNNKRTLVDDINAAVTDLNQTILETKEFDVQGRNLLYLLDPSCSVCIGNYTMFLESLRFSKCKYDSIFTIVLNSNYLMNVEYYLNRDSIYRPATERYIIDNNGDLTEYYNNLSSNNSILLIDGGKLAFYTTVFAYKFEKGLGLVRGIK